MLCMSELQGGHRGQRHLRLGGAIQAVLVRVVLLSTAHRIVGFIRSDSVCKYGVGSDVDRGN
jgi:hypothetical protein